MAATTSTQIQSAELSGLPDGVVCRQFETRSIDKVSRSADFIASTDDLDSYGERVEQVWDLSRFKSNPVILYNHSSWDLPIGTCTRCEVVSGALECTIQFCTEDMNPVAEQVWKMVQAKVLRGVSVGFKPQSMRMELEDGEEVWILSDNVLYEISVTPIPANPVALAKMKAKARASAQPKTTTAEAAVTEKNMSDVNDSKALLAARESEIVALKAASAAAEKTAADRIADAEAKATANEKRAVDADAKVKALESAAKTLETEHTKACTDRDANAKARDEFEAQLIELEVEGLVGKKITAAEKGEFVELRKSNKDLFTKMVSKRSDLKLTEQVIPPDTKAAVDGTPLGAPDTDAAMKRIEELGEDD